MSFELLGRARELGAREQGLAVAIVGRADGSSHATVVNAGVLEHPITGEPVVGFVSRGGARKLSLLRSRPQITVLFRSGWDWVTVEGTAELLGPDDHGGDTAPGVVLGLVREVYASAVGGTAEDWAGLDAEFIAERHTAVLVRPERVYAGAAP